MSSSSRIELVFPRPTDHAPQPHCWIDLSRPDNSDYAKGRSKLIWALWYFLGSPLVESYLLPISKLKCLVLRAFGAKIGTGVYIKPGVKVKFPWSLSIGDHCWIGERAWIDNLAQVTIGSHVCISQDVYLCTGNHDWTVPNMKLFREPIALEDGCWIGARATLCPGITVKVGAIVAVGGIVTKSVPPYEIWGGNPAHFLRKRQPAAVSNAHTDPRLRRPRLPGTVEPRIRETRP